MLRRGHLPRKWLSRLFLLPQVFPAHIVGVPMIVPVGVQVVPQIVGVPVVGGCRFPVVASVVECGRTFVEMLRNQLSIPTIKIGASVEMVTLGLRINILCGIALECV